MTLDLQGSQVQALIDTGASQNYMSPQMVQYIGLKTKISGSKGLILADGNTMASNKQVTAEFMIEAQETIEDRRVLFCDKFGAQHIDEGWYQAHPHK